MKKKTLYIVTLEPIEKRYTKQWYQSWKKEFSKYFDVKYIDGKIIDDKIDKGRFLDINKTNIWKSEQSYKISKLFNEGKIKKGDKFLFMDGWHFGITALKYMSQLNNIPVKIYAYWHAGTWDKWDFISQAGLNKWASYNEAGWINAVDGNFVSTQFHKTLMVSYFGKDISSNRIHVVGFPMDWEKEIKKRIGKYKTEKRNLIVFPHRVDKEKQPNVFNKLKKQFPNYEFVTTIEVTKDKEEYYRLLAEAKVVFSASLQETFGIGTVEAMCLGAIPVVPNRLSYIELYDELFKYNDMYEAKNMIKHFIDNYYDKTLQIKLRKNKRYIINQSFDSITKMAKLMQG